MKLWAGAGLVAVGLLVGSSAAFLAIWAAEASPPKPPPLLRDLTGSTWEARGEVFRQRILKAVPVGSPEPELLALLRNQGFQRDWEPAGSSEHSADYDDRFRSPSVICGSRMQVSWRVDQADRVTAVSTVFGDDGCP